MKVVVIVIFIIIAILAILAGIYIYLYNKLQKNIIRVNEAESEIDDTLRKRYDILRDLEDIINDNTKVTQENFKDFDKEKIKVSSFDFDRKLTKVTSTFNKIWQDYPVELEKKEFRKLMTDLKINEEKNEASKAYYNKFTTELNTIVKKFPSNIIARIHKIEERDYFDGKNLHDKDLLDFKY